jgi:hypothetical protein
MLKEIFFENAKYGTIIGDGVPYVANHPTFFDVFASF